MCQFKFLFPLRKQSVDRFEIIMNGKMASCYFFGVLVFPIQKIAITPGPV